MDKDLEYKIRQRAYELWEADGAPAGRHLDYWLAAEKELRSDRLTEELDETFPASDPPSSTLRGG